MVKIIFAALLVIFFLPLNGQSNIYFSSQEAADIMASNYDPSNYAATNPISAYDQVICELNNLVSADSLKSYLEVLGTFHTRHTFSDTTSQDTGIGAARRWAMSKFQSFSKRNEQRLIPSYLVFDFLNSSCGNGYGLKNILALLPGSDTSNKSLLVVEAHIDSRCEGRCDATCFASGIEDNGSGTALVLELARLLSGYTFEQTLVFMLTVGEEQGLHGAEALAEYCVINNIPIEAVQNNDVIGGVICGDEASPPGCPGKDHIDSTTVRIYSSAGLDGPYRTFARSIKIFYEELLLPNVKVPMNIAIMPSEDRGGRGGDHIPFRERGFRNVRFTAANEHGDGTPQAGSLDRQHTSRDILGVDTDGDNEIDSFYVDFNYLARNTVINGLSLVNLAAGPPVPEFILHDEPAGLRVEILSPTNLPGYRIGVRSAINNPDFDSVYFSDSVSYRIPQQQGLGHYVSVAGVDQQGVMSAFSAEQRAISDAFVGPKPLAPFNNSIDCQVVDLEEAMGLNEHISYYCYPNPFQGETTIRLELDGFTDIRQASLLITDVNGKLIEVLELTPAKGIIEIPYKHKGLKGMFFYSLKLNGEIMGSRKMIAF